MSLDSDRLALKAITSGLEYLAERTKLLKREKFGLPLVLIVVGVFLGAITIFFSVAGYVFFLLAFIGLLGWNECRSRNREVEESIEKIEDALSKNGFLIHWTADSKSVEITRLDTRGSES